MVFSFPSSAHFLQTRSPAITRSLWRIVELIITDFIDYWYIPGCSEDKQLQNDGKEQTSNNYS